MSNLQETQFDKKYNSALQMQFLLADTQNLIGELGRGSGKSTEIIGPRIVRMAYDMPQSSIGIVGPTYVNLVENILPAILQYFRMHYKRGVHYEFGKEPPGHFKRPFTEVFSWKHTISTVWGTVFQLVSADRPESSLSKSFAHIVADEVLRIPEQPMVERIFPTLRGNREVHGHSHYFGGYTLFSSAPNFDNDHRWWIKYENDMNEKKIEEIMYVAYRYKLKEYDYYKYKHDPNSKEFKSAKYFMNKWSPWLKEKRRGETAYIRGSSFSNIAVLGFEFIQNLYRGSKDFEKFKTTILNIRSEKVEKLFFAKWNKKFIFSDSYTYRTNHWGESIIDTIPLDEHVMKNASTLRHYHPSLPLIGGWDPGSFMSLCIAQTDRISSYFRVIKNFYHYGHEQHEAQAEAFSKYFSDHKAKKLILHYDRAGNKRRKNATSADMYDTDALYFARQLELRGWRVELKSLGQRTIYHSEQFALLNAVFDDSFKWKIRVCENECAELISSINHTPAKEGENGTTIDKSAEKNLSFEEQILYSPQLATSFIYMLWGEFSNSLVNNTNTHVLI